MIKILTPGSPLLDKGTPLKQKLQRLNRSKIAKIWDLASVYYINFRQSDGEPRDEA
jgi:hypothetical protein